MSFVGSRNENRMISGLDVEVVGFDTVKFVNTEMIDGLVRSMYDSLEYRSKKQLDLFTIENKIQELNSVLSTEVFISIDNNLSVKVEQRNPIARIMAANSNYYLDENGEKMKLSPNYTANVIIVRGSVTNKNIKDIYTLIRYIDNDEVLKHQIVSIYVNESDKYSFRTRKGNQTIEFGKAVEIEQKFDKLLIFYQKTISDFGWNRYKIINLKYTNQVVCTKR